MDDKPVGDYPYAEDKKPFPVGYWLGMGLLSLGMYAEIKGMGTRSTWVMCAAMGCMFVGGVCVFFSTLLRQ